MTQIYNVQDNIIKFISWSDFRPYIDGYYSSLSYFWSLKNNDTQYVIVTEMQGGHFLEITLPLDGGAAQLDFETNFKNIVPRVPGSNNKQGIAGSSPWPVDIQGATVSVASLQQLSVQTKLSVINYDLSTFAYSAEVPFAIDSLLSTLELRFSTASVRNITLSLNDGTVLFTETANTSLLLELDFEDYAIDTGTTLTLSISQTSGACLVSITLTAKVGTSALAGGAATVNQGTSPWITKSDGYVSYENSTTIPLLANQIFIGAFQEVKDYASISISIFSDTASEEGIKFDWSGDGINIDKTETASVDANFGRAMVLTVRARYFRVRFQNDIYNQTVFRLSAVYHTTGSGLYTKPLDAPINSDNFAQLTQSVVTGQRQDGYYGQIGLDNFNRLLIALADSPNLDAFGRLRISHPHTLFDSKMISNNAPLFWDDQQISGSGTTSTFVPNKSAVIMSVSNTTAGERIRQTFRRFNYQPGKSTLIAMTCTFGSIATGITERIGYFDGYNGLYFESAGTTFGVVVRSFTSGSVVNNKINQNNWNLDKLDGTGLSGINLDISKVNIFIIDFQWFGAGRIRFGFNLDGNVIYCHQVINANLNTEVYMSNPNLPLRYTISNDGTGPASSLSQICSSVIIEGGIENTGYILNIDRGVTGFTTASNTSLYPVLAMRLQSSGLSATVNLLESEIICTTTSIYRYAIILNPTVTGTPFSFTPISGSAVEADVSTTSATTLSGGVVLASGYGESTGSFTPLTNINFPGIIQVGVSINGVSDIIVLAVQRITGASETFFGQISWKEES